MSEPAPEVQNGNTDKTVRLLQPAIILARSIETFCQTFRKAMVIDDAVPSSSTPSTASISTVDDRPKKGKGRDFKKVSRILSFILEVTYFISL